MTRPTIHITNWSSRKLHGHGRKLSIMARPRAWEHGDGRVPVLTPSTDDLLAVKSGAISEDEYRARFVRQLEVKARQLAPDELVAGVLKPGGCATQAYEGADSVRDGDTLLCACSREAAAEGRCHRVWAAQALAREGWRVILDGVELEAT